MDEKNQTKNTIKGITLIALVITIIVLLILAGVSIATLTGQDNLMENAAKARDNTNKATEDEKVKLAVASARIAGEGNLTTESLKNAIGEQFGEGKKEKLTGEDAGPWKFEGDLNSYTIDKQGIVKAKSAGSDDTTNKDTGPLGDAPTEDVTNFGKKVNFKSKGTEQQNLIWRIFYEDNNNVYLISEKENKEYPVSDFAFFDYSGGNYTKKEIVQKYNNGADVSKQGQDLMPLAKEKNLFETTNNNIIATAYMCDTSDGGPWEDYKDSEGKAAWAMGGPTIELFEKSYNAVQTDESKKIKLTVDSYGYTENTSNNWFTTEMNNGIYRLKTSDYWWLASPSTHGSSDMHCVYDGNGYFSRNSRVNNVRYARPVVCIPRSNFNDSMILED